MTRSLYQKKLEPDYHRLKTMVKRSIEQDSRNRNFGARNGNFQKNAVVKNQGTKQRVQRILGDCWQWETNGQCVKGDNCSFRHDINKRGKMTQPNPSPNSFMQQNETNASRTRSPRGKSPSGRMSRWPCKASTELAPIHSEKSGTLQNACCTRPRVVADLEKSALLYIARLMNSLAKGPKRNDDKSAVAMLKKYDWHENVRQPVVNLDKSHERTGKSLFAVTPVTRKATDLLCAVHRVHDNLGCVFQDMEPPKLSSILRKSSDKKKPIRCVKIHKAVVRHADIRDQNPSLGMICPGEPHERRLKRGLKSAAGIPSSTKHNPLKTLFAPAFPCLIGLLRALRLVLPCRGPVVRRMCRALEVRRLPVACLRGVFVPASVFLVVVRWLVARRLVPSRDLGLLPVACLLVVPVPVSQLLMVAQSCHELVVFLRVLSPLRSVPDSRFRWTASRRPLLKATSALR